MSVVQTSYPNEHDALLQGQMADTTTADVDSLLLKGAADVPFGMAVCNSAASGAGDRDVDLGVRRVRAARINDNNGIAAGDLTITVDSLRDTVIRPGTLITIASEVILVSAATATTLTVVRAQMGSTAAGHANNAEIFYLNENEFRGIACRDIRLPAQQDVYETGDVVSVLWRGDVAVKVSAAVSAGDEVVAATAGSGSGAALETTGQLSSKLPNATHTPIAGARFLTSVAAQGLAVVRLAGPTPAR